MNGVLSMPNIKTLKGFVVAQTPFKTFLNASRYCQYKKLPLEKENLVYDIALCKELTKNRINEIEYIIYYIDKEVKECEKRIQTKVDEINNKTTPNSEKELIRKYLINEQGQFHSLIIVKDILLKRKWELYEISRLKKEL